MGLDKNPSGSLEIQQGQFFKFALPTGWRVAEDGQFAVVLMAPDNAALTIMVGNSGLPANYDPRQFVYERLSPQCPYLSMAEPRPSQPIVGCAHAWEFDYTYTVNGVPCRGVAKCSVAPSYGMCTMVLTCAASQESQWPGYASWLPLVANQVAATNGAAFGMRGVMQQNLNNSREFGEAARQYRDWSARTWGEVTRQREESQSRNNFNFRENLGNVQTFVNPYDSRSIELPTTYSYYWVNRQGQVWSTNDPSANPNVGSTEEWVKMNRYQP